MASDFAPASEVAVQLPAPARSPTVPPSATRTADALDRPGGAAIRGLLLVLLLRRMQDFFPAKKLNAGVACITFSVSHFCLQVYSLLRFCFLAVFRRNFVYVLVHRFRSLLFYRCTLYEFVACFVLL